MKLIKLTEDGKPMWINVDHIIGFSARRDKEGPGSVIMTTARLSDSHIEVEETPPDIAIKIEEAVK